MSESWSIRSNGTPYFAMRQVSQEYMDAASLMVDGISELYVEFRLHALPVMSASMDECHALVSVGEFPTAGDLLEVGISPSGAICVNAADGFQWVSADAMVLPGSHWYEVRAFWDYGTGDAIVTIDGATASGTVLAAGVPRVPSLPALGKFAMIRLFNNAKGISRTDVSIRSASVFMQGSASDSATATYNIDERGGSLVGATLSGVNGGSFSPLANLDLTAEFAFPFFNPPLWGTVPDSNEGVEEAYRWNLTTDYTGDAVISTAYTEEVHW